MNKEYNLNNNASEDSRSENLQRRNTNAMPSFTRLHTISNLIFSRYLLKIPVISRSDIPR